MKFLKALFSKDNRTTIAGAIGSGLAVAALFVKNPDTKQNLMTAAVIIGGGGVGAAAADAKASVKSKKDIE